MNRREFLKIGLGAAGYAVLQKGKIRPYPVTPPKPLITIPFFVGAPRRYTYWFPVVWVRKER